MKLTIEVSLEPGTPDLWVSRCVELDVISQAAKPEVAIEAIAEAVRMTLQHEMKRCGLSCTEAFETIRAKVAKRLADDRLREFASKVTVPPTSLLATAHVPSRTPAPECDHGVAFDEQAWRELMKIDPSMPAQQVRERWPRLFGDCPKGCGYSGISYASMMHYIAGDW